MKFKLGDVIKNKMKPGPHFLIVEINNDGTVKALNIDGPDDGQMSYFSIEDMWVFETI